MTLDNKQIKALKTEGHHLKPVIRIGQKGITDNLIEETDRALEHHELIKIHISGDERESRREITTTIATRCSAEVVSSIGKTALLYRKKQPAS